MKLYFNQLQPNISWKASSNNIVTIVPKNIKNKISENTNITKPWSEDCPVKKYKFNANPIRHYRKQYVNLDSTKNTFSNHSLIGSMDKPGNNIVTEYLTQNETNNNSYCSDPNNNINSGIITYIQNNSDCKTLNSDKTYDNSSKKVICISLHPSSLVIKSASTKLSTYYASSYRELLYKHNKTFNQNLPAQPINCSTCVVFNPSNTKYRTQGPISSSARTSSLKYDRQYCTTVTTSNTNICPPTMSVEQCNEFTNILQSPVCYGCINEPTKIRRKRINILK